ncbi:MAG: hypothetical protein PXX73_03115 [Sideroxydans sp.]|nr:hypothetical protein [Sideroxydans sp.]
MNQQKQKFADAFRNIANAIEKLSEDDISKLSDESFSIEIRLIRKKNKVENLLPIEQPELGGIIKTLADFSSRNEALQFLNANFPTRKSVDQIARKLDIAISKQDKVETLREKVIEATVGARIRSQAIQGNIDRPS